MYFPYVERILLHVYFWESLIPRMSEMDQKWTTPITSIYEYKTPGSFQMAEVRKSIIWIFLVNALYAMTAITKTVA